MKQSEHQKEKISTFYRGANIDISPNLVESLDGFYLNAQNMRLGDSKVMEKIGGEEQLYTNELEEGSNFICIGSCQLLGHLIEVWADSSALDPKPNPFITVDGYIMLRSENFDVLYTYPLQMDVNESCIGGEFAFTDFRVKPYLFNLGDIIEQYELGNLTYFDNFNSDQYTVSLNMNIMPPRFHSLVASGNPMKNGSYAYSMRYVDATGNRTGWSLATPLIPLIEIYNSGSSQYPYVKTYGDNSSETGGFGIKIQIQVSNNVGYQYIELKRDSYTSQGAEDVAPTITEVYSLPDDILTETDPSEQNYINEKYKVIEFTDSSIIGWETYDEESESETDQTIGSISAAKAIRFYDKRLWLGNIKYPTKDLQTQIESIDPSPIENVDGFAYVDKLGKIGHNDPYNTAYKKSYPTGERFSFGIQWYNEVGERSLCVPLENLKDFKFPNRRDKIASGTDEYDYCVTNGNGAVTAAAIDNTIVKTYELFDLEDAISKTDTSTVYAISTDQGDAYNPLTPIKPSSTVVTGHNCVPCDRAYLDSGTDFPLKHQGFAPNYYALGLAVTGLPNRLEGQKGFSIMRSRRANRVVCQGIGVYSLTEAGDDIGGDSLSKETRELWCNFPDMEAGYISIGEISTGISNGLYKLEIVSPLGYFSEPYCCEHRLIDGNRNTDFVTYARILHETGYINGSGDLAGILIGCEDSNDSLDYYTKFGMWRNPAPDPSKTTNPYNKVSKLYTMSSISLEGDGSTGIYASGRGANRVKITLEDEIYAKLYLEDKNEKDVNTDECKEWHEPFYIINIVQDGALVPEGNSDEFIQCGNYVPYETEVGVGLGVSTPISLKIVNERWEDSCININSSTIETDNVYCYVETGRATNNFQRWLNITYKTVSEIDDIRLALDADAVYIDTDGNSIYGVYTQTNSGARFYTLEFAPIVDWLNQFTVPIAGARVKVLYDNRFPVRIFGGDVTISENVFCPIDGFSDNSGTDVVKFNFKAQFPFYEYMRNENYKLVKNARAETGATFQAERDMTIRAIRQWVVMFACETKVPSQYAWGLDSYGGSTTDVTAGTNLMSYQWFPIIHYIQRPQDWSTDDYSENFGQGGTSEINYISLQYLLDFPVEHYAWGLGGFRFRQASSGKFNVDYNRNNTSQINISKPKVGWVEKLEYCTRVIWSEQKTINEQDDPNLKTFPTVNVYDIEDNQGEIKYLFDNNSEKGNNIIIFTEKGVCLLLVNKNILSGNDGTGQISYNSGNVVNSNSEIWLDKQIGVNDEMWRSIAEYSDFAFFSNNLGVYIIKQTQIIDIIRETQGGYKGVLLPILSSIASGYTDKVNSVYDTKNDEYWLGVNNIQYIFKNKKDILNWIGRYTYVSDKFICINNNVIASRSTRVVADEEQTDSSNSFLLNVGDYINGSIVSGIVELAISPLPHETKEAIDISVYSDNKPTSILIGDDYIYTNPSTIDSNLGQRYLRNYNGYWYNFIPRRGDSSRNRLQNVYFYIKLIHNTAEKFVVRLIKTGYKILK